MIVTCCFVVLSLVCTAGAGQEVSMADVHWEL